MFKLGDKIRVIKSRISNSYYENCYNYSSNLDESKIYTVDSIRSETKNEQYIHVIGHENNHPHDIFELVSTTTSLQKPRILS